MKERKTIMINNYEFEVLRRSTIEGGSKLIQYERAYKDRLYQCYKKPSDAKIAAFERCKRICTAMKGKEERITGSNGWAFQYAFTLPEGQVIYITKDHDYVII